MTVATASTIKTQLEGGSYPENTLSSENIYDYKKYAGRRRYPSCEIETIQPQSTTETKKSTEKTVVFEIHYYTRTLGAKTDEIANQKLVEDEILSRMEAMTLQDHKVVFESKTWSRQHVSQAPGHPSHIHSTLRISIRQITSTTATQDGVLKFKLIGSSVDNPPAGDYTYTNVFDVDLASGYRDMEEGVVNNNIPLHFAGHLSGNFICNTLVKSADLGSTGEKLNKMPLLNSNGEKPTYRFEYTNKTTDESTITNTFDVEVTSVQARYTVAEGVVFRIIAKLISDITVTIT